MVRCVNMNCICASGPAQARHAALFCRLSRMRVVLLPLPFHPRSSSYDMPERAPALCTADISNSLWALSYDVFILRGLSSVLLSCCKIILHGYYMYLSFSVCYAWSVSIMWTHLQSKLWSRLSITCTSCTWHGWSICVLWGVHTWPCQEQNHS